MAIFQEKTLYESGDSGQITSPNYPRNYVDGLNYYWLLTVEPGQIVEVTMDDVDLEDTSDCRNDFLKIYDGSSARDTLLRTYCGRLITVSVETLKSSGNKLYIHFKSDDRNTRPGFKISWEAVTPITPEGENVYSNSLCCLFLQVAIGFLRLAYIIIQRKCHPTKFS